MPRPSEGEQNGSQPGQIVLHLDVNGTLALGDTAGKKSFAQVAYSLADGLIRRIEEQSRRPSGDAWQLHVGMLPAIEAIRSLDEEQLTEHFTVNYSGVWCLHSTHDNSKTRAHARTAF